MEFGSFHALFLLVICAISLLLAGDKVQRYVYILFLCFPFIDFSIPPGALGIKIFDVLTLLVLPFYLKSEYYQQLRIPVKFRKYFIAAIALMVLSSLLAMEPFNSLLRLWQQANYVVLFLIFASFITGKANFLVLKKLVLLAFTGCVGFLLLQVMLGVQFNLYGRLNPNVQDLFGLRYPGPFQDPQKFAQYISMSMFLLLGFLSVGTHSRWHFVACLVVSIACIGLTGARASLFGLALGAVFINIKRSIISGQYMRSVFIFLAGGVLYFAGQYLIVFQRVKSTQEDFLFRYAIWEKAFNFFLEHPLLGIGPGSYQAFVAQHDPSQYWKVAGEKLYFDHPESGVLLWLVEYGLPVFITIIIALAAVLNPVKGQRKGPGAAKLTNLLEAGLLCWCISFLTVYSLSDKRIGVMVILLAAMLYHFKYVYAKTVAA